MFIGVKVVAPLFVVLVKKISLPPKRPQLSMNSSYATYSLLPLALITGVKMSSISDGDVLKFTAEPKDVPLSVLAFISTLNGLEPVWFTQTT